MRRVVSRALVAGAVGAAVFALGSGIASADETPIWLVPGVDAGSVLDPTIGLPTAALAPVDSLLTFLAG
ncbi:hypothetical protein [Amycolatopsis sp.]|uniref:hypothetical protein n=1 Tax=Amycolatopsis sp. TaxID=37632 RepID=UPI002CF1CBD0|nr:hypothetical protein [Amycolatopsis sp.]HVV08874.1 hypothetical protein [Amycolatopsis sp.]